MIWGNVLPFRRNLLKLLTCSVAELESEIVYFESQFL